MAPDRSLFPVAALLLLLEALVPMPAEANELVPPGADKTMAHFQADDASCRQWAAQNSLPPGEIADQQAIQGAVLGTFWGAGLGALFGAAAGDAGLGAAIGAGSGLIFGAVSGAEAGRLAGDEAQRRYDAAYQQCLSTKGNRLQGVKPPSIRTPPPAPPGTGRPTNRYDPPYPFLMRD